MSPTRARRARRILLRQWHILSIVLVLAILTFTTRGLLDGAIWLIALLPIANWLLAALLVVAAWPPPRATSLVERAAVGVDIAISSTMAAAIAFNRLLGWHWPSEVIVPLLALALILISAPAFYWFHLFINGRFGAE